MSAIRILSMNRNILGAMVKSPRRKFPSQTLDGGSPPIR
jgi:hypothetical protein